MYHTGFVFTEENQVIALCTVTRTNMTTRKDLKFALITAHYVYGHFTIKDSSLASLLN